MKTKATIKSKKNTAIVAFNQIESHILEIRGQKVMLDADLSIIYGVPTKRLNEQVKRNIERFPDDFMFKLTKEEASKVVANCDHLKDLKFSYQMPYAFTEHGALMLASILNSAIAIHASVSIVRAFVKMRSMLLANKDLAKKIDTLEKKSTKYDENFKVVFDAIRQLMLPVDIKSKRSVGFHVNMTEEEKAKVLEKADDLVCEIDKLSSKRRSSKKSIQTVLKRSGVVK